MMPYLLQAQAPQGYLFASDRIYTVLTVVLIVLAGLIVLLLLTNRRVSRLEKALAEAERQSTATNSSV